MSKQKHDIGYQKRRLADDPPERLNTHRLAVSLVDRGLASSDILDQRFRREPR